MVNHHIFTEEEEEHMVVFLIEQVAKKKCITITQFKELLHEYKAEASSKEITQYWLVMRKFEQFSLVYFYKMSSF